MREKDRVMYREEKERASIYMDWGAFGLEERNQLAILFLRGFRFGQGKRDVDLFSSFGFGSSGQSSSVSSTDLDSVIYTEGMGLNWSVISGTGSLVLVRVCHLRMSY